MSKHEITVENDPNWPMRLAAAVKSAPAGTVIIVDSAEKESLALRAIARMGRADEIEVHQGLVVSDRDFAEFVSALNSEDEPSESLKRLWGKDA